MIWVQCLVLPRVHHYLLEACLFSFLHRLVFERHLIHIWLRNVELAWDQRLDGEPTLDFIKHLHVASVVFRVAVALVHASMWLLSDDITYYVASAADDLLLIVGATARLLIERSQLRTDVQWIGRCEALQGSLGIRAYSALHAVSR